MRRFALLLIGCLLLIAGASALDGYGYYQTIDYAATDQAVYQQDLVIHRTAGTAYEETSGGMQIWHLYTGTNCQDDYGDLRFTNPAGTELPYYLWPDYDSNSARVCVRIEDADQAGVLTVWYGNLAATTSSDGGATYGLFCDFDSAADVAEVFDTVGTPDTTYADSIAMITCNAREFYQSKKTFSRPALVEFRMADTGYGADQYPSSTGFGIRNQGGGGYHVIREAMTAAQYGLITCNGGTSSVGASLSHDLAFQDYQIDWVSGTSASLRKNGVVVSTVSSNIPAGPLPVTFGRFHYVYSGNQMRIDWILVRTYSATPPAASTFSGEQEATGILYAFPGIPRTPQDLNGDGLYTDINGNGRLDYNDLTIFFQNIAWAKTNQPTEAFDFNGNSRLDYDDVTNLFTAIMEAHA